MTKLKRLSTRVFRIPRYFRARSRRFVVGRSGNCSFSNDAATEHASTHQQVPVPMDLFPGTTLQVEQLRLRDKYGSRRKRKRKASKKKARGLQYKLQYWKGVKGKVRERKFTSPTYDTHESNDIDWTEEAIYRIAGLLVDRTFEEIRSCSVKDSLKIAEAVAWMGRRFDDSPFNFDFCCSVAGYSPEALREKLSDLLLKKHGTTFPHYTVLRNGIIDAEYGDSDAIEWVLSDAETPLSFVDCCRALSFDPLKARSEVLLPVVTTSFEELTDDGSGFESETFRFEEPVRSAA